MFADYLLSEAHVEVIHHPTGGHGVSVHERCA